MHTDLDLGVNGAAIFARRWDPAVARGGAPLILLHDSLGCVELWRDFPAMLARELRRPVIAYDRVGFGRSSPREQLPSANFIRQEAEEFFPALRQELGITEFAVFGHSVGGSMALLAAAQAGDSCKAVVCESAQAFVEDRTVAGILQAKALFQQPEQFERLTRWYGTKARWVLDSWTKVWLSPEFSTWTLQPDLPRVRCPVLVLHGDQDEYGSVRFPELICRHVGGPSEMHIMRGCGHVPHRERPDDVVGLVRQFAPLSAS